MTKHILILRGSLRKDSFNQTLANYITANLGTDYQVETADIGSLPLMNQDLEFPVPAPVAKLRQQVAQADALWLISPEYNGTIPGVLKNALDWLSRPTEPNTFGAPAFLLDKPVAISGAGGKAAAAGSNADLVKLMQFMGLAPLTTTVGLQIPTSTFMTNHFDLDAKQQAQLQTEIDAVQAVLTEN